MNFYRPKIVISKCINFENCRYNWDKVNDDFILKLSDFVDFVSVCPEVWIWLWIPRMPIKLFSDKKTGDIKVYQGGSKLDLTEKMQSFSKKYLNSLKNIDWFIMKNRSPSCWIGDVKVYPDSEAKIANGKTSWIFAQNIQDIFTNFPLEDEWRLKNFRLREEFLTKIFCMAHFREINENKNIKDLQDFQAKNKYLFMFFESIKNFV